MICFGSCEPPQFIAGGPSVPVSKIIASTDMKSLFLCRGDTLEWNGLRWFTTRSGKWKDAMVAPAAINPEWAKIYGDGGDLASMSEATITSADASAMSTIAGQSRKRSAIESVLNVIVGYWAAIIGQCAIFPLFGIHIPLSSNLAIGAAFTIVSLIRSYAIRRLFNARHIRGAA